MGTEAVQAYTPHQFDLPTLICVLNCFYFLFLLLESYFSGFICICLFIVVMVWFSGS